MEGGRSMLGETFIPYCKYDVSDALRDEMMATTVL
jgi:hypothetical protein